jgi:hypothetical protein
MRSFRLEQDYDATPLQVMDAMMHPSMHHRLVAMLPDLESRQELRRRDDGDVATWDVLCVPRPRIPGAASHVVTPEMITWEEHARLTRSRRVAEVTVTPASFRTVFRFQGTVTFNQTPAGGCRRVVEGRLWVRIPFVGGVVEDYIVSLIRQNMEAEGEAVRAFLEGPAPWGA